MAAKIEAPINTTVSCPWGKTECKPVSKFTDVVDEEYAKELEKEEITHLKPVVTTVEEFSCEEPITSTDTTNDMLLAQMLQLEFDKENDTYIKSLEKSYNGTSKVSMSFQNFRTLHPANVSNDWDESDDDDDNEDEDYDRSGMSHAKFITKHDSLICERKNAKQVEMFPLKFPSGDVGRKDIRLPNHVYNKLKIHSKKEERNEMRLHEKREHSTHEQALDENTRLILYKMVNNEMLDSLSGIVSTGKEAVVIHAKGGHTDNGPLPAECALKVFKTTLNEFKTREKYITDDHRFRDRYTKQNPRKIVKLWAEKEFRNLTRMKEAGINCPEPVCLRKHILVMKFIGTDQVPAPKLKDAQLSQNQLQTAYEECIHTMKCLYEKCNLIHADLSEYNMLWHHSKCYFIDVSQSVEPPHPNAHKFLLRDCGNIINFFTKSGLQNIMRKDELFTYVCGKDIELENLDDIGSKYQVGFESNKELLTYGVDSTNYNFDYHFEQAQSLHSDEQETRDT